MKSAELKPCPFCGEDMDLDNCNGFITCGNCEAQGPSTLPSDHEYAAHKWNQRRVRRVYPPPESTTD